MCDGLLSVGLDVGTTSTQMVVSRLHIQNNASSFAVPEMVISQRELLYTSPVHFTPLIGKDLVDAQGLRGLVLGEYEKAGITREEVDTGAVIITGETSRRENARAVLDALSDLAGEFVVATAGPHLESILAARGAGAVEFSEKTGKRVLHMDIGGGTSNLALIEDGHITETGCLNIGGRLVKSEAGKVTYVSPAVSDLTGMRVGEAFSEEAVMALARTLAQGLEMAAGLRQPTDLLEKLTTQESGRLFSMTGKTDAVLSFSGGVADCIDTLHPFDSFGDMGGALGRAIRESRLCEGPYRLGEQTIRATVVGAGCHSAQLSGSTVFHQGVKLPIKNCPVVCLTEKEQALPPGALAERIRELLKTRDAASVLALPGLAAPGYKQVKALAQAITTGMQSQQILVAVKMDMAKALGQAMALQMPGKGCLCIDGVALTEGSFLDIGAPVGPALPVVVKTLILAQGHEG